MAVAFAASKHSESLAVVLAPQDDHFDRFARWLRQARHFLRFDASRPEPNGTQPRSRLRFRGPLLRSNFFLPFQRNMTALSMRQT